MTYNIRKIRKMYKAARGTADILPEEQPYWRYVEKAVAEVTRLYGYQRIDTPTFEETALFTRSVGEGTDIVEKEMYTFEDKGGNSITLSPEGTAPVCRAYIENGMFNLPQPVKLYYLTRFFRYERPQAGRLREYHQFGYEAFGDENPALDAEVIDLASRFYTSLGLKNLSLQLNSIGCRQCRPVYLDMLKEYYSGHVNELCDDCKKRLVKNPLRLLDCKQPGCQAIADAAPASADNLCQPCAEHFTNLQKYLSLLGVVYKLNHRLVRGLDYYTRTVFEFQPEEEGSQSTIGGGGRYDGLIEELGGKPTPAIGFATGIERIILNLKRQGISVPVTPPLGVLIASMGDTARDISIKLTADLRQAGVSAATAAGGKSLKAQLRQANALGARFAVIIGEDEVKAGTAALRDMSGASQETVPLKDLAERLRQT
jgi:histidyl-tRNA synthetase